MYLFFDTETTGLPRSYSAPVTNLTNWPRLVQLAWLLTDSQGNEVSSAEYIIKPEGFVIPSNATKIHGITTKRAQREGTELHAVLAEIILAINQASVLIAHNMQFDEKILGAELLRSGYSDILATKERKCTMQSSTNFCKIPSHYGYKWPTLQELYKKLFNEQFADAHQALVDVRACSKCFFELKRRKLMS
jgi:DNA polymerase III epsilon subunit-like protein